MSVMKLIKELNEAVTNVPIDPVKHSAGIYGDDGTWNAIKWIDGEPYRDVVQCLIIKNASEVFLAFLNDGKYIIPGGSKELSVSDGAQVRAECAEEAHIIIDNIICTGIEYSYPNMYTERSRIKNMMKGKHVSLYVADYVDNDDSIDAGVNNNPRMLRLGKFYNLQDIFDKLYPEHKKAIFIYFQSNKIQIPPWMVSTDFYKTEYKSMMESIINEAKGDISIDDFESDDIDGEDEAQDNKKKKKKKGNDEEDDDDIDLESEDFDFMLKDAEELVNADDDEQDDKNQPEEGDDLNTDDFSQEDNTEDTTSEEQEQDTESQDTESDNEQDKDTEDDKQSDETDPNDENQDDQDLNTDDFTQDTGNDEYNQDGDDENAPSSPDTTPEPESDETKVNINILKLSDVERAMADKRMYSSYQDIQQKCIIFKEDISKYKAKMEQEDVEVLEEGVNKLIDLIDEYIKFKFPLNNFEQNKANFLLFSAQLNEFVQYVSDYLDE